MLRKGGMKALVFDNSLPRLAFTKIFGFLGPQMYTAPTAPLRYLDIPEPTLTGDDWALLETSLCGVCGSDYKQVFLDGAFDNPLTAYISFPHVIGHEAVGRIAKAGKNSGVKEGQRVLLYPNLSCGMRGLELCEWCVNGHYTQCLSFTQGDLSPALHSGNSREIHGGMAPLIPVHARQCIPIPDDIPDEVAVLGDPFGVALHAILRSPPPKGGKVLVYGCGTIGLAAVAVLRYLYPDVRIFAVARFAHQSAMATKLGADVILPHAPALAIVEKVAQETNSQLLKPWNGIPVVNGGVDVVYDTIGKAQTLEVGVRVCRSRGTISVLGVATPARFEWTPLYFKEISIVGSNAFAMEELEGRTQNGMAWYLELVGRGAIDLSSLVTHTFPLADYRKAFAACHDQASSGAIKVVLSHVSFQRA